MIDNDTRDKQIWSGDKAWIWWPVAGLVNFSIHCGGSPTRMRMSRFTKERFLSRSEWRQLHRIWYLTKSSGIKLHILRVWLDSFWCLANQIAAYPVLFHTSPRSLLDMVFGKMEVIVLQPKYTKQKTIKLSFRERITSQFLLTANGVPQSFFFFFCRMKDCVNIQPWFSLVVHSMLSQHGDETLKAFKRRSMHEILFSITWASLLSLIREFRILFWENWFNLVGGPPSS